ncbi:MAG: aminodeoxychorismate/anthranilate synthase component II, partial [Planctomycetota bacterium]
MTATTKKTKKSPAPRVLLIDNYDSFTFNLYQYLSELGAKVTVRRNDEVSSGDVRRLRPDRIVISPGPGRPADAGNSPLILFEFAPTIPILGVCLGHQMLGEVFGGDVVKAPRLMHGKVSDIRHVDRGVFAGLPHPLTVTRYHSLMVSADTLPDCLAITAYTDDGIILGLRHRD